MILKFFFSDKVKNLFTFWMILYFLFVIHIFLQVDLFFVKGLTSFEHSHNITIIMQQLKKKIKKINYTLFKAITKLSYTVTFFWLPREGQRHLISKQGCYDGQVLYSWWELLAFLELNSTMCYFRKCRHTIHTKYPLL